MKSLLWSAAVAAALMAGASPLELTLGRDGDVRLGETGATLRMHIHHEGWRGDSTGRARGAEFPDAATGTAVFDFRQGRATCAAGRVTLLATADRRAVLDASVTSAVDQKPECVVLTLSLPAASFAGASWTRSDGKSGVLSKDWDGKTVRMWNATAKWIEFAPTGRDAIRLTFPTPTKLMLQDSRKWASTFHLRISPDGSGDFGRGAQRAFACIVSSAGADGVSVSSVERPTVVEAGPDWIPLNYLKEIEAGSALDFSGQGLQDAPAGKHGWLKSVNGHFEFENLPGKKQRFYGVNLCGDANMPERAFADVLVERLVRLGYNAVRVHHYEADAIRGAADGLTLNAEMIDRLDYFLAKCFEKGIYATTDLFVSRPVAWRAIGIDRDGNAGHGEYKDLVLLHEPAFANWAAFAKAFLSHVNPYTGRAYRDEPGLAFVSLVNEGGFNLHWDKLRKTEHLKAAWAAWLATRRADEPDFAKGADDPATVASGQPLQLAFADHLERAFIRKANDVLRGELGVKALFTNQNLGPYTAAGAHLRSDLYDYVDTHFYVDHPEFLDVPWHLPSRCANENPVRAAKLAPVALAFGRLADKPFTVSEWNFSGPGMFRGVGGILTGGLAALQDWDGLWRFAYSHGLGGMREGVGFPHYFDAATDPLIQASDRACLCLFLRGDLAPLADGVANVVPPQSAFCGVALADVSWRDAAWQARTAASVTNDVPGYQAVDFRAHLTDAKAPVPLRPNPAVALDRARGSFRVVTPKTAGGFVPGGALDAGPVAFDAGDVAATVWASSLDGRPLAQSRRILLTHLTDVQADGNVYAEPERRTILRFGKPRPVVRNGRAAVRLSLDAPEGYEVWALETNGRRAERVPCEIRDGRLCFTADVNGAGGARMLYEIEKGNDE